MLINPYIFGVGIPPDKANFEAWWAMESNVVDSIGSNNLTASGSPSYVSGLIGNAIDLEVSSSQYASIADNASLSVGDIDFWMGCVLNLESSGANRTLMSKFAGGGGGTAKGYNLNFIDATSKVEFTVFDSGGGVVGAVASSNTISTGVTHTVQVWHDKTANKLFLQLDGDTPDEVATSGVPHNDTAPFGIGALITGPASQHWDGWIDEAFFAKMLPSEENRIWIYNSGNWRTHTDF